MAFAWKNAIPSTSLWDKGEYFTHSVQILGISNGATVRGWPLEAFLI